MDVCSRNSKSAASKLRLVQINLKHCILASENLLIYLIANNIDLALIQEPWIDGGKVKGLDHKEFQLFYLGSDSLQYRPRSCILVRKCLNAFLFPNFSDGDTTTISLDGITRNKIFTSSYFDRDKDVPTDMVRKLVMEKKHFIIGADANARHLNWGSRKQNNRVEQLFRAFLEQKKTLC